MNSIVYYYLTSKQYIVNLYNSIIIRFFGFKDIRVIENGYQYSVVWRYLFFCLITKIINSLFNFRKKIDIKSNKLHLTKITEKGEKTIIFENDNVSLNDVSHKLKTIEPDDNMLDYVIMTFELENPDDKKICLKNFIIKYKDSSGEYNHTLKNIFVFNNIDYHDESVINVKLAKNRKIKSFNIPVKDVEDKHINYLINLEP